MPSSRPSCAICVPGTLPVRRRTGPNCAASTTRWRDDPDLAAALDVPRLERAIGVIYRPETELRSHYFEARLGSQFDAWVWFEQTGPVTPLAGAAAEGAPDTYPFGL